MHLDSHVSVWSFSVLVPSVSALGYTWDLWCTRWRELRQWFVHIGKHDLEQSFANDLTMTLRQTQRDRVVREKGRSERNCGSVDKVKPKLSYLCSNLICVYHHNLHHFHVKKHFTPSVYSSPACLSTVHFGLCHLHNILLYYFFFFYCLCLLHS